MAFGRAVATALVLTLLVSATAAAAPRGGGSEARSRTRLVEVSTPTPADKQRLQRLGLDLTEHGDADSVDVVLYGDADERRLRDAGFTYTVRIPDLAARDAANRAADERYAASTVRSPLPSGRTSYRHLEDYEQELIALAAAFPHLARSITLSERSWEGRPLVGIEITRGPDAADGKPTMVVLGAHHAREWPSAEHSIELAYDLLVGYGTDAQTTRLVDATRTIVVPVVNPDGFVVSREARPGPASQDFSAHDFEMKRKNCRDVVGTCDRRTRLSGVDLNRNYGALWGGSGASPAPLSDGYRGPAPFSEPEVRAVRDLIATRQVQLVITNHTFGNLVLRSPGTIGQGFPHEEPAARALGERMTAHNGYANLPGFGLYDTTGTTEDWTFWTAGALTYTFEIGPDEFHPPYETGVVAEYLGLEPAAGAGRGGNRAAYLEALEAVADSSLHSVLTGSAPPGARLTLSRTFETSTSPVCADDFCASTASPLTFADALGGSMVTTGPTFEWHVNPSTRPIVAGRDGRDAVAPAQTTITMVNDPAVEPDENPYYPSPAPRRVEVPYETFDFDVLAPPAADNELVGVHIEWTNPATDWDLYVYDDEGELVGAAASFGDADEDVTLFQPPPGRYTAVIINWDQGSRAFDDWRGEVGFNGPSAATSGPREAWQLQCEAPDGAVSTQQVIVERGQVLDVGEACRHAP